MGNMYMTTEKNDDKVGSDRPASSVACSVDSDPIAAATALVSAWLQARVLEDDEMWPRFSVPEEGEIRALVETILECVSKANQCRT